MGVLEYIFITILMMIVLYGFYDMCIQEKRDTKAQYDYMENKKKMVSSFNKHIESFDKYIESENEKLEHLSDFNSSLEKLDESLQRLLKRDVK